MTENLGMQAELSRGRTPPVRAEINRSKAAGWAGAFGLKVPLPLGEFAKRVWDDVRSDDCTGMAAQMSYFFCLAMFPFFLFVGALVGYLPFTGLWAHIVDWITHYFPSDSREVILRTILGLTHGRTSFGSIGFLGTAWAAASGLVSLVEGLNRAYEVKETRSVWKVRGMAVLMLFVLSFLFLTSYALLTGGEWLSNSLAALLNSTIPFHPLWHVARWLLTLVLLGVALDLVYYALPNVHHRWQWTTAGSFFVAMVFLPTSIGFNFYARHFTSYSDARMYGALGAFVIFMLWIYVMSLIFLVGAEINSEMDKAAGRVQGQNR